jgi:hypothetical protein
MALRPIEGQPGKFYLDETGKTYNITSIREDDFYDTMFLGAVAAITSGQTFTAFDNITGKPLHLCNMNVSRKLPGRHKFDLLRVGAHVRQTTPTGLGTGVIGPTDVVDMLKVYDAGYLHFKLNGLVLTEGPVLKYQSGYGVTGHPGQAALAAGAQAAVPGLVTLGVPSAVSAPKYMAAQPINDQDDIEVTCGFGQNKGAIEPLITVGALPVLTGIVQMTIFLRGIIEKPATN